MHIVLSLMVFFCLNVGFPAKAASENNLNKLAVANNELGVKLYHRLTQDDVGNIFFSPLSLSTAFGMLFVGTGGNSAKQLKTTLGYSTAKLSSNKVSSAFNQYLNKILQGNQPDDNAYVLNLANELLLSDKFDVNPDYIEKVQNCFHAYIKDVDFAENADQIVKEVNDWVSKQTNGKIDTLLTELDPLTLLVILNAVYFKGTWQTQFYKKLTLDGIFYNYGQENEAKNVPFMHVKEEFPYFKNDEYQVIELPYKGKDISMIILLPTNLDGLQDAEDKFSPEDIKSFQDQMRPTVLNLSLPKFKIEYSHEMSPDFKALGATDIFDDKLANFSVITKLEGLSVTEVMHKAAVEVNEEGSEAAAATGIVVGTRTVHRDPEFIADHPFMLTILDKRNNFVLFFGRVTNL